MVLTLQSMSMTFTFIVGPDLPLIVELKNQLAAKFKTTDLGTTSHYLGIEVLHKGNTTTVTQTLYIDQLLATHQMSNCNPAYTPMVEGLCLAPAGEDYVPDSKDVSAYQRFTGSIQWLAYQTRPDILQTVAKLSQHNIKPTEQCWTAVTRLYAISKGPGLAAFAMVMDIRIVLGQTTCTIEGLQ